MSALEFLRENWAWGVIVIGIVHCWMVYLAHYRAPQSPAPSPSEEEGEPSPDSAAPTAEVHEFPGGIRETNLPVPTVLWVFYLIMGGWALAYILWIRFKIGSY